MVPAQDSAPGLCPSIVWPQGSVQLGFGVGPAFEQNRGAMAGPHGGGEPPW